MQWKLQAQEGHLLGWFRTEEAARAYCKAINRMLVES